MSMATIQELVEFNREEEWRRAGVLEGDIRFSALSGIDGRDVRAFRETTLREKLLIVVRCPKVTARPWHGLLDPKPLTTKQKTGTSGVVVTPRGRMYVSDYDLMCVWRRGDNGYAKVSITSTTANIRGPFSDEAKEVVHKLNEQLVSRIQHGCQDDLKSPKNPGIKPDDHFAAFTVGAAEHLASPSECVLFYARYGFPWLYDASGKYNGPGAS
jgi:hypothetical protein